MASIFCYPNLTTPVNTRFEDFKVLVADARASVNGERAVLQNLNKEGRRQFLKQSSTKWPCITLVEGINPSLRVSKNENPPQKLYGFIADYDAVGRRLNGEEVSAIAERSAFPPTFGGPSLSGNGYHVVWLFEESIPLLGDYEYAKNLIKVIAKNIRAGNFLDGLDPKSMDPSMVISIDPIDFYEFSDRPISKEATRAWAADLLLKHRFKSSSSAAFDLNKVYEAVEAQYPGRWQGPFAEGCRGVRFWDASASDLSAAMVTKEGMVYFTDGGGFKPWSSIIGQDFVAKFQSEQLVTLTEHLYYVEENKEYVLYNPTNDQFRMKNWSQMAARLVARGAGEEDVLHQARHYIEDYKDAEKVIRLANLPRGYVKIGNSNYINNTYTTYRVPEKGEFPFIASIFKGMFPDAAQWEHLMAWIQDSHQKLFNRIPSYAQVLFMAGDARCGKSLLQFRVLTPLFGGTSEDPMSFFTNRTDFNEDLADAGHWLVSDQEGPKNNSQRSTFDQQIKAITANPKMRVHAKFKRPQSFEINCRVSFSLNKNVECLSIIPRLGQDIMDKIILLDVANHDAFEGLTNKEIEAQIFEEIPAFSHWLLYEYKPDPSVLQTSRYSVKSYHHPLFLSHARALQTASSIMGYIHMAFDSGTPLGEKVIEGKSVSMPAEAWRKVFVAYAESDRDLSTNYVTTQLFNLVRQYPHAISAKYDSAKKIWTYSINYKKLTNEPSPTTPETSPNLHGQREAAGSDGPQA